MNKGIDKTSYRIRKAAAGLLALFAAAILLVPMSVFSRAEVTGGKTYRIGVNTDFGISHHGGSYSGLAYDYIKQLEKYTGDSYIFTEGTPGELFDMMSKGEIDIIPCVTKDELDAYSKENGGEELKAGLSGFSIMTKFSAIYVPDSARDEIALYDFEKIKQYRIGYLAENETEYFSDGRFLVEDIADASFVRYSSESALKEDFFSGRIDAAVKSCLRNWNGETIVYRFGMGESFFLVSENAGGLAEQLTTAVGSLYTTDPEFSGNMYQKHVANHGAQKFALSDSEMRYVKEKDSITVAYNTAADMTEFYDSADGGIVGITGTMLDRIEEMTGLSVVIKPCDSLSDCAELLERGEADAICGGVNYESMKGFGQYFVSAPYSKIPIVIAGKRDFTISEHMKIAVPFYCDDIGSYIVEHYPNSTTLPYDDVEKCIDAVNNGEADVVCAGAYEIIYVKNGGHPDIEILETTTAYHSECIAVASSSAVLGQIIGKSLAQISNSDAVVSTYDSMTSVGYDSLMVSRFLGKYFWVICITAVALLLFGAALINVIVVKTRKKAKVDAVTGGRTKERYLSDSQALLKKSSPKNWAVVLFDVEKFKFVNDRLGFLEGNMMLGRIYKVLEEQLKKDEVFARISDDNFACTIHNGSDNEISERINNIFDECEHKNALFMKYPVLFSAGVCRLDQCLEKHDAVNLNTAIDRCAIARKTVKGGHSNSIAFYDGKIREQALREKDFENAMPAALAEHEFQCYLQPKYGLRSRHIEGAEALIRWNSKDFGFVYPDQFIPISEKNGFVVELDFFILEEVCKAMRRWIKEGKTPVVVSVNQSRLHLRHTDYIWRLREIVDKYEIPYKYIELELTESAFTEDAELLLKTMNKLHEIGFKLSIDDFGSGYSSLNMLKDIPADVVKIDREFFNGTVNSRKGRTVISTVVDLAKNLDMQVISEGVETVEQVEFLSGIDCAMVQGYFFAKPMPMKAFEEMWKIDLESKREEEERPEVRTTGKVI